MTGADNLGRPGFGVRWVPLETKVPWPRQVATPCCEDVVSGSGGEVWVGVSLADSRQSVRAVGLPGTANGWTAKEGVV